MTPDRVPTWEEMIAAAREVVPHVEPVDPAYDLRRLWDTPYVWWAGETLPVGWRWWLTR